MSKMKLTRLDLSWSTSRGQDTYGYNICRLDDAVERRRFKCMGGGYDMTGTVFGEWLSANYQERLQHLFKTWPQVSDCAYQVPGYKKIKDLYGITLSPNGVAHCDGGCGLSSMEDIAKAIGLDVQGTYDRKGHRTGWVISEEIKEEVATA